MKPPKTRSDWIALMIAVAILGSAWVWTTRTGQAQTNSGPASPDLGRPAPDFTLTTLDGISLRLSDLRGTPVIVNFWATWCPPCRVEIPALEAASQKAAGEAMILGVNVQENPDRVRAFTETLGMTYPVALDTEGDVARLYRVRVYPTTYFIDASGVIVDITLGPLNEPLLQNQIDQLGK